MVKENNVEMPVRVRMQVRIKVGIESSKESSIALSSTPAEPGHDFDEETVLPAAQEQKP